MNDKKGKLLREATKILIGVIVICWSLLQDIQAMTLGATSAMPKEIRVLNVISPSPSEEPKCMLIDRQGLIWIGSDFGLKSYDGYRFVGYRNDANTPNILPHNTVLSLTEGKDDCLWIGTRNGLAKMDKRTGRFHTISTKYNKKPIYTLYTSHDGTLWMGTDNGIAHYCDGKKGFYIYNSQNTTIINPDGTRYPLHSLSVKSFAEDKDGQIYIGTWEKDLYRLDPKHNVLYRYMLWKDEENTSAFSLKLDKKGRLWIGTWGKGIKCLTRPRNIANPGYISLTDGTKAFSIIYKIAEDPITHTIWVCSREGIGIIDEENIDQGIKTFSEIGTYKKYSPLSCYDLCSDYQGSVWALSRFNGIFQMSAIASPFHLNPISDTPNNTTGISSIFTNDGQHFWLSLLPVGIALYDKSSQQLLVNMQIPGFEQGYGAVHVSAITQRPNGEIYFASNGYGMFTWKNGKSQLFNNKNSQLIKDNYVSCFHQSRKGIFYIGESEHLDFILPSGKIGNLYVGTEVKGIYEDHQGCLWLATREKGIIRINGNLEKAATVCYTYYNYNNRKFLVNEATSILEDSKHRIWAISNSGGLFRYNKKKDCFDNVSQNFHWDIDRIFSMTEDAQGSLWLTTDKALICLHIDKDDKAHYTTYTNEDGLGKVLFTQNSCHSYGKELYFGSGLNLISFEPQKVKNSRKKGTSPCIITDLIIDDKRYAELDTTLRNQLSDTITPSYMRTLTIPASIDKFSIEFALLSYINTDECKYAYYLEGYDSDWHYVDASIRRATFENIPSGTYKLHIKAADSYGVWSEMPYTLQIKVLPPWYATWWAYLAYLIILLVATYLGIRWYSEQVRTKNRRQMAMVFTNNIQEFTDKKETSAASTEKMVAEEPHYDSPNEIFVKNAIAKIEEHLTESDYGREQLAADLCISSSTLYNKLKAITGMNVTSFITSIRMKEACRILKQHSDIRINELSYRVGFSTPRYFSQCFKKEYGMSVKEFAETIRTKNE